MKFQNKKLITLFVSSDLVLILILKIKKIKVSFNNLHEIKIIKFYAENISVKLLSNMEKKKLILVLIRQVVLKKI